MEDYVLSIPTTDRDFISTLASRMGWSLRSKLSSVERFIQSCSTEHPISDEEIQQEQCQHNLDEQTTL